MHDVFISTVPFGEIDRKPLELLEANGISYRLNPTGKKLSPGEIGAYLKDVKVLIGGTEQVAREDIAAANRLRLISRVGIGLDNVDLSAARDYSVAVAYTPDAPSPAVAELTIGLILDLARGISVADKNTRSLNWKRYMGKRLKDLTIGILGVGRIGFRLVHLLQPFRCRILAHDRNPLPQLGPDMGVEWVSRGRVLAESDIVTIHLPLTPETTGLIRMREFDMMKPDSAVINTSRGGIVDEGDLYRALSSRRIRAAALDVFEREPYQGNLRELDNIILTQHMGSCTVDCRLKMELEATEDAIRFLRGEPLKNPVPNEYFSP